VATWDSEWAKANEGYSDDEIELIIKKLRADPSYGPDHVEVDVATKAPFQNYDNLSVPEILKVVELTGTPAEAVIAYEIENANRQDLLKRLEGVEASDDTVVVSA
jgi:copper chaperone CopZ